MSHLSYAEWIDSLPDGVDEKRVHALLLARQSDEMKQAGEFAFYFPKCLCEECVDIRKRYGIDQ